MQATFTTAVENQHTLNQRGTNAAAKYLDMQGYTVLERDWQSSFGSVDLIVGNDEALIFVEVHTITNQERGLPEDVITKDARMRNEKIAISYLTKHDYTDLAVRFDIVSILVVSENRAFLRHHQNAYAFGD